jgi:hypothetical protein
VSVKSKQSPVWPPFPGSGDPAVYRPMLADQLVAERKAREAARKGYLMARERAKAKGTGWGAGTVGGLSRKSDEAIAAARLKRRKRAAGG